MNCSRKEFLTGGLVSFGRDLVATMAGTASGPQSDQPRHFGRVAIDQKRCLAAFSGCFTCIDHCPTEAIQLGREGLSVVDSLCDACGQCAAVCPITPAAITLISTD